MYSEFPEHERLVVDIHNYTEMEAKHYLERLLVNVDPKIKEVVVIHGYNNGKVLQRLVREKLRSKKILARYKSMNDGITNLIIKH